MDTQIWRDEHRTTLLCVDSFDNSVLQGRLFFSSGDSGTNFESLIQFLQCMERTLEGVEDTKSFVPTKPLVPPRKNRLETPQEERVGKLATFSLRVLFQQNASWQGVITWLEGRQSQSFRSVLDLTHHLNSALTQGQ